MCDKSSSIKKKSDKTGFSGNFVVNSIPIGATYDQANSFRAAYQNSLCTDESKYSSSDKFDVLSQHLMDPKWAEVTKACINLYNNGITVAPTEIDKQLILSFEVDPATGSQVIVRQDITGFPSDIVTCKSTSFKAGRPLKKGTYEANCKRTKNVDVLIQASTNIGNFDYVWGMKNDPAEALRMEVVRLTNKTKELISENIELKQRISPVTGRWLFKSDASIVELASNGTILKNGDNRGDWRCVGVQMLWDVADPSAEHWDDRVIIPHDDSKAMVGKNRHGKTQNLIKR